ncbi:MAG: NAD-dependent epimerase/dehydratase family protein [Clostridium fessum]
MKIVVTGATSFVGLGAVRELLHRGHQVYAVLREHSTKADLLRENGKFPQGLTILEEDLGNLSKLPERIPGGCDVFLHMGWRGAGSDSRKNESVQEESVQDALNAVRVAKALGCRRFLFTGSQAESGVKSELTDEETVCEPTSRMDARNWQYGSRRKCSAGNWDWIGHARFSARMTGRSPVVASFLLCPVFRAGRR